MANLTLTDVFFKAVKQDLEEQEERNPKAPKFSDLFGTDGYADQLDEIQEDTTSMEEKIETLDKLRDDCKKCGGTGYYFVANGEDDVDKEMFEYCNNFEIQANENKEMRRMEAEDAQKETITD